MSGRNFRRLCVRYEDEGVEGLRDRRIGKVSPRRVPSSFVFRVWPPAELRLSSPMRERTTASHAPPTEDAACLAIAIGLIGWTPSCGPPAPAPGEGKIIFEKQP